MRDCATTDLSWLQAARPEIDSCWISVCLDLTADTCTASADRATFHASVTVSASVRGLSFLSGNKNRHLGRNSSTKFPVCPQREFHHSCLAIETGASAFGRCNRVSSSTDLGGHSCLASSPAAIQRPVGLMDKGSASGAGDQARQVRFSDKSGSHSGHLLQEVFRGSLLHVS